MRMIIGYIITAIMDWVGTRLGDLIAKMKKDRKNHDESVNQAKQDTEKLKTVNKDSTADETDQAIDDSLKHL